MYTISMSWIVYAFISALFAALTAILAKIGIKGIDSNLATAIRTVVILIFAWSIVLFQGTIPSLRLLSSHTFLFLILSGITTGISWLFYFRALQLGTASQVAPIDKLSMVLTIVLAVLILKEKLSLLTIVGTILMSAGALCIALG
jgi:transporter family protein